MCVQIKPIPRNEIDVIIEEINAQRSFNYMPDWPARRPSAFPGSEVGLIISEDGLMASEVKTWGYEVSWSKQLVVNTRDDSAMDPSKMWWDSIQHRRCIIPTFGFFEPHKSEMTTSEKTGKAIKQQYFFETANSPVTFIAGIYENNRFSMMTTQPNASMLPIHHRMPMVLLQDELPTWLWGNFDTLFNRKGIELVAKRA
ncbi:MAG: SOS response-associated peptidase family protein [Raoultibacter sp.]|jgi:putative SOS response-associated peptidase YedK